MGATDSESDAVVAEASVFATTHWSAVLAAHEREGQDATQALERLCRTYWPPLYAYLRRRGSREADAQDLVQGFFASLLAHDSFPKVDPKRGKFRSFLLGALKNFLANEHDRTQARKRGGGTHTISWEAEQAENSFHHAQTDALSPDLAFDRSWALTLLNQVLARLREEYRRIGKAELFEALQIYLSDNKGVVPYAETATRLHLGTSAIKMSIRRLRQRYGELLRIEIARTVSSPDEIEEEIRALFAAVTR